MTLLDYPLDARLGRIEERLTAVERDLAVIKEALKHIPTPWLLIGLILPLYGLMIFGFAGVFYFLLNYAH
jgi:hypothetical protein